MEIGHLSYIYIGLFGDRMSLAYSYKYVSGNL